MVGFNQALLESPSAAARRHPGGQQCGPPGPAEAGSQAAAAPLSAAVSRPTTARKNWGKPGHMTTVSWIKYYFDEVEDSVIQSHFNSDLVQMECENVDGSVVENGGKMKPMRKGNLPVHNSMDALAAAALSYGSNEGPKLVHRLDRESSGLLLMGRTKESVSLLNWLFSDLNRGKSSYKAWNNACEATYQRFWALVIGSPKEKEGLIRARLSKVLLDDGKTERIILAQHSGFEASQEAVTEYRLRVHCAEALGTPIVGDYKYGWFVHQRWKQMPRVDIEPTTGAPYKLRRPEGLDIQKGSVLSRVPLLHLHCREIVLPNIAKFLHVLNQKSEDLPPAISTKPDLIRAATFDIRNNCPYTVWAAAVPGGGRRLDRGQNWVLNVNPGTAGARIWARTDCQFDGAGRGKCQTGDCGGLLQCQAYGVPPNTLAEFALNQFMNLDFIDISNIDGFNVPMEFSSVSGGCNRMIRCTADIVGQCPNELKVPGGCNGPCPVFKTDEHCCNSGNCGPTNYSRFFKERCPDAYSYPKDDQTSVFTCPGGTNYKVVFCPGNLIVSYNVI
ncbi:hypothetical protein LWI29_034736 [Acer saccharum]|uniref:Pseudouridine synthase RsuA/RluA-like domain-containing protein n=1 Tax=Acer saccharum TaxID=4024 RepID=A0AA39SY51_ACESA|nr:hypothetical protein LWI29_034736 [Acer saccharum]